MPRLNRAVLALAALSACVAPLWCQGTEKTSVEFRKDYIAKFPWTTANTTAGDAMLLRIMVETRGARRGLEIGSNTGYGAINMGIAFERTSGKLTSLEISPRMVEAARKHIAAMGLEKTCTVMEGDALKTIPTLQGDFDFVFIDAAKPQYLAYLKALEPKLKPGATLVADNVIDYARQMKDFLDYIQSSPDWDTQVIRASMDKNDGMLVAFKIK